MSTPRNAIVPVRGTRSPTTVLQGRLPHAVAPHHAHHLAVADRQVDARQDAALAVVDVDPADGQHQAAPRTFPRPRYASITRSSACTRSSEPSESTVPSCSTVTR